MPRGIAGRTVRRESLKAECKEELALQKVEEVEWATAPLTSMSLAWLVVLFHHRPRHPNVDLNMGRNQMQCSPEWMSPLTEMAVLGKGERWWIPYVEGEEEMRFEV